MYYLLYLENVGLCLQVDLQRLHIPSMTSLVLKCLLEMFPSLMVLLASFYYRVVGAVIWTLDVARSLTTDVSKELEGCFLADYNLRKEQGKNWSVVVVATAQVVVLSLIENEQEAASRLYCSNHQRHPSC